jgi:stage II sporulation protein AA (anti-sigma F factor antagonist)
MGQASRRICDVEAGDPTPVLRALKNDSSDVGRRLQTVVTNAGTTTTITLDGEWDLAARDETRQVMATELARHPARLVLDLSQVTFIDSSALHVLIDLNQYVAWMNVQLLIVPGPKNVQRVFEICGLADRLPFTDPCDLPREPAVQASRGGT